MKLLIVDDSAPMRQLIRRMVSGMAEDIGECSDGSEVIERYGELLPDWVLMDIEMGAVNGLTATRQLRAIYPKARVLIVTNYDDPALRAAAEQAGACGYVLKENLFELTKLLLDANNQEH